MVASDAWPVNAIPCDPRSLEPGRESLDFEAGSEGCFIPPRPGCSQRVMTGLATALFLEIQLLYLCRISFVSRSIAGPPGLFKHCEPCFRSTLYARA